MTLSAREREVLRQIGDGYSVSEIAAALNLSVKTVSTYRARLLEKLGDAGAIPRLTTACLMRYAITNAVTQDHGEQ